MKGFNLHQRSRSFHLHSTRGLQWRHTPRYFMVGLWNKVVLRWCLTVFSEVVSVFGVHICLVHDLDGVWCSFQGSWYMLCLLVLDWGKMGHKHNLHFGWHTQWLSHSRTPGWMQLGLLWKLLCYAGECSALQSFKSECVEHGHTLCGYTKLTFHLHHARHSCLVFTALWCGCSIVKLLSSPDPILALASMD